jgi:hypothetical protein
MSKEDLLSTTSELSVEDIPSKPRLEPTYKERIESLEITT